MNIIEKQTELGKSLYEINSSTMKELFNLQRGNIERYIEVNREFGSKLPEIRDISTVVELQREYGQTLWTDAKSAFEAQTDLLKGAFSNTKDALKVAYTFENGSEAKIVEAAPVAKTASATKTVKAKAKAKPRAKAKKSADAA